MSRNINVLYVDTHNAALKTLEPIVNRWKKLEEEFGPLFILPKGSTSLVRFGENGLREIRDIDELKRLVEEKE